jgi:hypothetical protein
MHPKIDPVPMTHIILGTNLYHKCKLSELNTLSYRFVDRAICPFTILELFVAYKDEGEGKVSNDIIFISDDEKTFITMLKNAYTYGAYSTDENNPLGISFKNRYSTFNGLKKLIDTELIMSIDGVEFIPGGAESEDQIVYKGLDLQDNYKFTGNKEAKMMELVSKIKARAMERLVLSF